MHRTMFDTPVLKTLLRWVSIIILKILGWKTEGEIPRDLKKCVMIAAPHTSNWDLPFTLMTAFALNAKVYWMGKEQIFKPPYRGLMMWMGGIPVDRSQSTNMVQASIDAIQGNDQLFLIVPPEGTRSKVTYWKTGFYHIAQGAGVPILMGFLDFKRKASGIAGTYVTTGDIEVDMNYIKSIYAPISGKKSDQFN
ncbi:Phospholipid/glycerol acyltransferase [Oleispira antarctica RB-8]|uniref:Phospholipid/glycerol acyltransferase n=1 Tax=Oleispira antarctica RB-8 TaxID=698738 RepID=R4YPC5_OLEAN|nr:Phospholipid/glycerol acyltransferase [Oleispira antarctica RB-8]|tara:strand:+ start:5079 stop:5660 length:582 start_codon:yes stop_codon:yes gene_type:complete